MTRLAWSDQAVADLAAIHAYIARDSERYAQATVEGILALHDDIIGVATVVHSSREFRLPEGAV